jgi:hypothetical protein
MARNNNTSNAATANANNAAAHAARVAANNAVVRMQQRIAAVQALRKAKHQARITARTQSAYMQEVQALAAKYNLPVPNTMSVRAYNNPQKHAPSAVQGACAAVHALAEQCNGDRKATLAACKAAGINPATAATQYAKWKKAQSNIVAAVQEEVE